MHDSSCAESLQVVTALLHPRWYSYNCRSERNYPVLLRTVARRQVSTAQIMNDRHDSPNTTLSPLRNILLMKRSLLTGFLPLPFGISVHISLTSAESHQYIALHDVVGLAHSPIRDCYACQTPLLEQAISAHFVKRRGSGCDSLRLSGVRTEGHCSALRWYTVSYAVADVSVDCPP